MTVSAREKLSEVQISLRLKFDHLISDLILLKAQLEVTSLQQLHILMTQRDLHVPSFVANSSIAKIQSYCRTKLDMSDGSTDLEANRKRR